MAWWCHAEACAHQSPPTPAPLLSPAAARSAMAGLQPRIWYRTELDGWWAEAADRLAALATGTRRSEGSALDGELTLLVARNNGDPQVRIPALRWLTIQRRLIFAWRARRGEGSERGVCFGVGQERMWGEAFFLLDADR